MVRDNNAGTYLSYIVLRWRRQLTTSVIRSDGPTTSLRSRVAGLRPVVGAEMCEQGKFGPAR